MAKAAVSRTRLRKSLLIAVFFLVLLLSSARLFFYSPASSSSTSLLTTVTATLPVTHHRKNFALREDTPNPKGYNERRRRRPIRPSSTILLPDWETLILLEPADAAADYGTLSCLFQNGAVSPATFAGVLPWSGNPIFRCFIPKSVRRQLPFHDPILVDQASAPRLLQLRPPLPVNPSPEMLRWNRLVYESVSTPLDVILFAKGINNRQGHGWSPSDLLCVFYDSDVRSPNAVRTPVTSSSQEVFRCPHPKADSELLGRPEGDVQVTIEIELKGEKAHTLSSVAKYRGRPPPRRLSRASAQGEEKSLICACTMVYNVAKFLPEWVTYHSAVGVDRFVLYDNGSEDDLDRAVSSLVAEGHNISTYLWPWPKTQEAGFSHCAATHRDSCQWMMYLDVDEFAFSPLWAESSEPSRRMVPSLLPSDDTENSTGQVMLGCADFGPSGQTEHPAAGVTQGYVCRQRAGERHKSLVRLDAVAESLTNVVHHFELKDGYESRRLASGEAVVNHYKYQAWPEFRKKFRRRVSAYVADWTQKVNPGSKDRTPGLGVEAVEPEGWKHGFCEVRDTALRDLARRWFAGVGADEVERMVWESER